MSFDASFRARHQFLRIERLIEIVDATRFKGGNAFGRVIVFR